MDDGQIHGTIEQLVAEEHELWDREAAGVASEDDRRRLQAVKVSLDQCWDLLRQRRAQERVRPGSRRSVGTPAGGCRAVRAVDGGAGGSGPDVLLGADGLGAQPRDAAARVLAHGDR